MTAIATTALTAEQAESLEAAFLGGLEEAQVAYERIVEHEAWTILGFETFTAWWGDRVQPMMRALSMRPTREIAAAVVEQVREEEAALPSAQRRTQRELAEMAGVDQKTISNWTRSTHEETSSDLDLEPQPVDPATACEACDEEMEPDQVKAGYMRCDECDSEGDHYSPTFPNGRNGQCVGCNPELEEGADPKPDETPMPGGQDRAETRLAEIDEQVAEQAQRPQPPKWDPAERKAHEAEVLRLRDIADAQQQIKTLVTDVRALVFTVLQGSRQDKAALKGLITRDMIADLRRAIDLLEGEIDDEA